MSDTTVLAMDVSNNPCIEWMARNAQMSAEIEQLRKVLELADEFITNGIDLGYIQLPDAPDPALETPERIKAALRVENSKNE